MKFYSLFMVAIAFSTSAMSQLFIESGGTLIIESSASVIVKGDVSVNSNIQGTGRLVMQGTAAQMLSMKGFSVPNLEIDNTSNVTVDTGGTLIRKSLLFTNGKIKTGNQDIVLSDSAVITGSNASKFVWTDGTGRLVKRLSGNITGFEFPVGRNESYRPAYLTTAGSTFNNASAGVSCMNSADPNRPPMIANALTTYWPVTQTGITGGSITISGQYIEATDISGTESVLTGYYYNGTDWSSAGETHDYAANRISAVITGTAGSLYAMNKFVTVGSRAFLQGAYSAATGLMSDALRTGTNLIPLSDPYRSTPYNTTFTHVNNPVAETAADSVFQTKTLTNNNIVDWVFLQLRNTNASPGNVVLQTRSALIQRDGDIVDIDGFSPVTFNNVSNGTYAVSVRHRNHLGLSTDPSANPRTFSEAKSTSFTTNAADIRTATDAQLFGTNAAYTTAAHPTLGTVNLMWGGNVNSNSSVRFQGPGNDRAAILTDLNSNELSVLTGYYRSDLNLNRTARYQGPSNDRSFLIATVLASQELNTKNEALPQ